MGNNTSSQQGAEQPQPHASDLPRSLGPQPVFTQQEEANEERRHKRRRLTKTKWTSEPALEETLLDTTNAQRHFGRHRGILETESDIRHRLPIPASIETNSELSKAPPHAAMDVEQSEEHQLMDVHGGHEIGCCGLRGHSTPTSSPPPEAPGRADERSPSPANVSERTTSSPSELHSSPSDSPSVSAKSNAGRSSSPSLNGSTAESIVMGSSPSPNRSPATGSDVSSSQNGSTASPSEEALPQSSSDSIASTSEQAVSPSPMRSIVSSSADSVPPSPNQSIPGESEQGDLEQQELSTRQVRIEKRDDRPMSPLDLRAPAVSPLESRAPVAQVVRSPDLPGPSTSRARFARFPDPDKDMSKQLKYYHKLHASAQAAKPRERLPDHRYWIVIVPNGKYHHTPSARKQFFYFKGNRWTTVETIRRIYSVTTASTDVQFLLGYDRVRDSECLQELDLCNSKLVVLRCVEDKDVAVLARKNSAGLVLPEAKNNLITDTRPVEIVDSD